MSKEPIEVHAEEIPNEEKKFELAIIKETKNKLASWDGFQARLDELKKEYGSITIIDINDKEGYEKAKKARQYLKSIRTGTEDERKEYKKPLLEACALVDDKGNWIKTEVGKLEDPIDERIKWFEGEVKKQKAIQDELEDKRLKTRVAYLKSLGADSDGVDVTLEDQSISAKMLRGTDDDIYESNIIPRFKTIFDRKETLRKEQEEKDRQEKERLDKIKKEQEENDRLEKERLDKQKKEQEDREKELKRKEDEEKEKKLAAARVELKRRLDKVEDLGMVYSRANDIYSYGFINLPMIHIQQLTVTEWDEYMVNLEHTLAGEKVRIEEAQKEEAEKENKRRVQQALDKQKQDDENERLRKEQELEEGKESEKYKAIIKYLLACPEYSFRSGLYIKKYRVIKDFLADLRTL